MSRSVVRLCEVADAWRSDEGASQVVCVVGHGVAHIQLRLVDLRRESEQGVAAYADVGKVEWSSELTEVDEEDGVRGDDEGQQNRRGDEQAKVHGWHRVCVALELLAAA